MLKTPQEIYKFIQAYQPGDWKEVDAEAKGHNKANEAWRTLIKLAFDDTM